MVDDLIRAQAKPQLTRAEALRAQIEAEAKDNLKYGRRYHKGYIALLILIVGSSALASILALGFDKSVDARVVGIIALIPGICTGVGDRFHFVLKKHWFYRKHDRLNSYLRQLDFVVAQPPADDDIARIARAYSRLDVEMGKAWEHLEEEHPPAEPDDD